MSLDLSKGTRVDLSKDYPDLEFVNAGLGWDPVDNGSDGQKSKGLRSLLHRGGGNGSRPDIDIDASCFLIDENGKVVSIVYFGNKTDGANGVRLSGDDLTGGSSDGGDDEIIYIQLPKVSARIAKLDLWANIYRCTDRHQTFGDVSNAYIRLVNQKTGAELCKFNLSGKEYAGMTAVKMGSVYRHNGSWKFNAVGEGTNDPGLTEIKARYQ